MHEQGTKADKRAAIVRDRLAGLSLTGVAKKHRVQSNRLSSGNETRTAKKTGVPQIANQEKVVPLVEGSNSQQAAA
jgi:hypothetical protein